jgi:hypothetical protein
VPFFDWDQHNSIVIDWRLFFQRPLLSITGMLLNQ